MYDPNDLRKQADAWERSCCSGLFGGPARTLREVADEIERLQRERDALRDLRGEYIARLAYEANKNAIVSLVEQRDAARRYAKRWKARAKSLYRFGDAARKTFDRLTDEAREWKKLFRAEQERAGDLEARLDALQALLLEAFPCINPRCTDLVSRVANALVRSVEPKPPPPDRA